MSALSFNSLSISSNFSVGGPSVTLPLNIGLNSSSSAGLYSPGSMMQQQMMGDSFLRGFGAGQAFAGGMPGFAQGFMAAQQMQQMQQMGQQMSQNQGCCKKKKKKKCCNSMQQNMLPFMNQGGNQMCNPGMNAFGNTLGNFYGQAFAAGAQFGANAANSFNNNPLNSLFGGARNMLGLSSGLSSFSMTAISSIAYA